LFIGAFNSSGNLLWQRTNTTGLGQGFGRACIDAQHNIYLAGVSQAFSSPDTFNSYPVNNTVTTQGNAPIVVKMDSSGNNIWVKNGSSNNAIYSSSLAINGSNVTVAGSYNGKLVFNGLDSFYHPSGVGEGFDIFILSLNASNGNFLKADTITSGFPDDEFANEIVADKHGNVYIGGGFTGTVFANNDTISNIGGGSDFFVAKYGFDNCNCTTSPVAGYTHSGTNTINFVYTGTTAGLDSVVWIFGDGSTATGNTSSHTYATPGAYYACVAAYTSCGSDTYCDSVAISTGIDKPGPFTNISIYPNPMSNTLVIQHAAPGTQLILFNLLGQQVYHSTITNINQQINTAKLPAGTYLLQLITDKGDKMNMTLIK
jgi:hypothetical protein